MVAEVRTSSLEEGGAARAPLVGKRLYVGVAAVVVDGDVGGSRVRCCGRVASC